VNEDSVYGGLLVDDAHWAFGEAASIEPGTHGDDPLAGMDTRVPDGVDARVLGAYALALGDDALVFAHRLSEWCSRAPDLEEDIALANISLDLLGQARYLLARAAAADPALVPVLPEGSPVPDEDRLAFFRDDAAFCNVHLAELPNGDFAEAIVRILLFSTWRLALFQHLRTSRDPVLAAVAAKGVNELAYHRDFAGQWFVRLAQGTEESRRRLHSALETRWPFHEELFAEASLDLGAAEAGVGVAPSELRAEVDAVWAELFAAAEVDPPEAAPLRGRGGRDGVHTEALSRMLAEMQSVARAHPMGSW